MATSSRKRILVATALLFLVALYFLFDPGRYLNLESLKRNREFLEGLYRENALAFAGGFIAVYVIQTALALPGAAILSLAAGAVFGVVTGTVYAVAGATIGATCSFLVARYLFRDTIQGAFGGKLGRINAELDHAGFNYLLFLRLVPVFPFFLINLAAGLTRMRLRTFVPATLIGIVPGGFVYCNAGASLASINSAGEIVSPRVLGSFALLGLFALAPVLYGKIMKRA